MSGSFDIPADRFLPARPARPAAMQATPPRLRECADCGQFQVIPALLPGSVAHCLRCAAVLRRTRADPLGRGLALNLAALAMLAVSCGATLMTVSTFGIYRRADLFSGPQGLERHGVWELSLLVLFTTVAAPLLRLGLMSYVLAALRLARPPAHLRVAFRWAERIRPWSMIEVYLLGVFVAYTKLSDLVHINIGLALYALGALMLTTIAADVVLDRQAVWEALDRHDLGDVEAVPHEHAASGDARVGIVACDICRLVSLPEPGAHAHCPRCGSRLEHRKRNSFARTWALVIASAILYIPANLLPVLTVIQLGFGSPSTILGGARELLNAGMWPLAALVFGASIMVPCLKLFGLGLMLVTAQTGSAWRLRDRTVLYRIVNTIGRWSMIDIFMESILIALVQFGVLVTIDPGYGAVAFAGVVILTMFAAESFDPRLMWDAAAANPAAA